MIRNTLALLVVAGLAAWSTGASACGNPTTVWGQGGVTAVTGTIVAGQQNDSPTPVKRVSGKCGAKAATSGSYLADGTPGNEAKYFARFYVYTGVTGGSAKVFAARNASNTDMITVTYNGTGFDVATTGATTTIPNISANRWYGIELDWDRTLVTPAMTVTVQSNTGVGTPVTVNGIGGSDSIDNIQLGWISGTASGGAIYVDAFESRRATAIGFICRADASGDGLIQVNDAIQIANEATSAASASPAYTVGNGDANFNGSVDVADAITVSNRAFIANACNVQP